jgi:four helix bundle protein
VKRKHHELLAWQEAIGLVKGVYALTVAFPSHELYALTSQMRRAAISVPSNIAEGAARTGRKEFLQFLSVSRGSLSELETQLLIARELGYVDDMADVTAQVERLFGLIGGLMNSLQRDTERGTRCRRA